ncbi:Hypothetical predicted protein [Olea europaea subsp. europaea]|uniref:Fatty acyl-CoA reductase n=1 Tax=Olea europaea subsp. europaea TaxID=158383 RepID=A0A8S0UV37_OLEEU|nr:Hypothetical predicted protein [Olea europaea subsp. europaea]
MHKDTYHKCNEFYNHAVVFLEKILRVQPEIKKLFLLIRAVDKRSAEQRLHEEVLNTELFGVLEEKYGADLIPFLLSKVIPVCGDVSYENLAYVQGLSVGLIPEKPFHMGETLDGAKISYLDIDTEKRIVEERLRGLEAQNATELEIASAMRNLGIDRTLDSIFVAYGKGKLKFFVGDPNSTLDMIPGDMVVNSMLVAMAKHTNQPSHRLIYHIGSSLRNPLKYEDTRWFMYNYLTKNPLLDTGGKPIKVEKGKILETMASFHRYIAIRYLAFVRMLKLVNMILCNHFRNFHANARRRIDYSIRLAELYKPYLFFHGTFDDTTTENLRTTIRGSEVFNFDPKCIQWDEYFMNTHFPGITKYALR